MASRAVWLDVDAGLDDAQGIFLLLSWLKREKTASLVGISCVAGNVDVCQVTKNVRRILCMAGADEEIPVFIGSSRPLVQSPLPSTGFFGKDGLGDVDETFLESFVFESNGDERFKPREGHASIHLIACARKYKEALTLIATGPLSTIALACRLDDEFPKLVGRICVMGGSSDPKCEPEFNFSSDPEAAHVCLESFPLVTLVTWECGTAHPLPWDWFYHWVDMDSPQSVFMKAASKGSASVCKSEGFNGYVTCDALAAAVGLDPTIVRSGSRMKGEVELGSDKSARGRLILTSPQLDGGKGNVILVKEINMVEVLDLLTDAFKNSQGFITA